MISTYCFDITNNSFKQITAFDLHECNEFVWGEEFYKHSELLYSISSLFLKLKLLNLPFKPKIGLLLGPKCFGKFNSTDKETTEESIISFFKLLQIPNPGIELCLYRMKDSELEKHKSIRPPFSIWRFRESWTGGGNYILRYETRGKDWLKVADHSWVYDMGMEVKTLGYGQTVLEHHELIKNCEVFLTQNSSGLHWSILMDCPILYNVSGSGYDVSWPSLDENLFGHILMETSAIGMNPDTLTLDDDKCVNKRYSSYVATYEECDNKKLLHTMLNSNKDEYKHIQNKHIKEHKDIFYSWLHNVKKASDSILDG